MDSQLAGSPDAQSWGVDPGYWDIAGRWRDAPSGTIAAILEAMGARSPSPPEDRPMIVVAQGESWPELPPGTLVLEDGGSTEWGPQELASYEVPIGYHLLEPAGPGGHEETGGRRTGDLPVSLAVCPARCPSPAGAAIRSWGWAAQLYAARSGQSWGIGDFADLRRLAAWSGRHGAGFMLLNPLHAPQPGPDPGPSPYFPSSRCFFNPLYLRVEDVPGAADLPGLDRLAADGRYLNGDRLIDRRRVWELKSGALEALFERFENAGGDRRFAEYVAQRGSVLDGYSTFCALAEQHGVPWQSWPAELRHPDSPAAARFASGRKGGRRKRYHAWLQWNCERQLASAGGPGLLIDLAVGVDGGGADAWLWQDVYAMGMGVGAPPDDFNVAGQDWSLPPWDPWLLRGAAYAPYIETLRAAMRHAAGLRLDHVMGLFRLFWIPQGCEPSQGAYVHYPWRDMVNLLCLEAWRAGAFVVGEDLGTVEDYVRAALLG
ncbi:MAG TPA: 4-alpha-glucanotransferase, partial [Acidimicrobiales bacterium]|nr:4-alpha-glucanotransferase [Acidimicrobiales bacterium]